MAPEAPRKAAEDLRQAADASPDDAELTLRAALALDKVSRESTAIRYYERALKLGLGREDTLLATVCLVSSFRNLHRYDDALSRIADGLKEFPDSVVLSVFNALIQFDIGESNIALYELGMLILKVTQEEIGEGYTAILRSKLRGVKTRRTSQVAGLNDAARR